MAQTKIFSEVNLSEAEVEVVILEGTGLNFFKAQSLAAKDPSQFMKFLLMELVMMNGKLLTETDIDTMHIKDLSYLFQVVNLMMTDAPIQF